MKKKKVALTLVEDIPCIGMCNKNSPLPLGEGRISMRRMSIRNSGEGQTKRKAAFTLAEVLITLAVIGVVAALTIPTLLTNINDKVRNTRITTINTKLKQGTDKLMLMGHINGYETTEDFMQALSQHMKILAYCSADKLTECYPYDTINVDGEEEGVNVSDLTTPEAFGFSEEDNYSNPVSFITGDGVPYIIMYKKDCAIDDGNGRSNSAGCIAGIYDWNGAQKPNKFMTDTDSKTGFAVSDIQFLGNVTKLGNKKVVQADGPLEPVISAGGKTYKTFKLIDGGGLNYCGDDGNQYCVGANGIDTCTDKTFDDRSMDTRYCSDNRWAAAKKKCEDLGMELPSIEAFEKLQEQKNSNSALNSRLTAEGVSDVHAFWTSEPFAFYDGTPGAYTMDFGAHSSADAYSVESIIRVICLGK